MHGFGQIAFKGYNGFFSPFDIVKHLFLLYLENIDVQIKIFIYDPKPWVILFGKSNRLVFTWRQGGHIGVPKQWNGGYVGVPNQSCGSWTLFLRKRFLLLQ